MRARPGRWVLSGATVAVGVGLLAVVVHDGSPGWQVLRGFVVVAATALLAGVVWSGGTAGGWAGAAVGLAGILVGGGIGVRHVVMWVEAEPRMLGVNRGAEPVTELVMIGRGTPDGQEGRDVVTWAHGMLADLAELDDRPRSLGRAVGTALG